VTDKPKASKDNTENHLWSWNSSRSISKEFKQQDR